MTRPTDKRAPSRVSLFALLSFCVIVSAGLLRQDFLPRGHARSAQDEQGDEKIIKTIPWRKEIVKVSHLKVKNKPVDFDKSFKEGDDWLSGLTLTLKNVSTKPVVFVELQMELFGKGDRVTTQKPLIYPLWYGSNESLETSKPAKGLPAIEPGESADITLSQEEYDSMKLLLLRNNYPIKMRQAELTVTDVVFADGTRWYKSMDLYRDPDNPGKWLKREAAAGLDKKPNPTDGLRFLLAKAIFPITGPISDAISPVAKENKLLFNSVWALPKERCKEAKPLTPFPVTQVIQDAVLRKTR